MKLHEWLYEIVCEICYDREYVYPCYVRHFGQLMKNVLEQGIICSSGIYEVIGIKSGLKAKLEWDLEQCVNYMGSNIIAIKCLIESVSTGKIESRGVYYFELSTGDETVGGIYK